MTHHGTTVVERRAGPGNSAGAAAVCGCKAIGHGHSDGRKLSSGLDVQQRLEMAEATCSEAGADLAAGRHAGGRRSPSWLAPFLNHVDLIHIRVKVILHLMS